MQFNKAEAEKYCILLAGSLDTPITWQVYFDPDNMAKRPDLAKNWTGSFNQVYPELVRHQQNLCGVYLTINETDGLGRSKSNIKRIRYFVVDYDNMVEPTWLIQPTFKTARDTLHGHAYWRITDDCKLEDYPTIQKRLAMCYASDPRVIDLSRVFRLAGSVHLKNPSTPAMYYVVENSGINYTVEQVINAHAMNAQGEAELSSWIDKRQANLSGNGITDLPRYIDKVIKYASSQATIAIEGQEGGNTLLRSCLYAKDHGISVEKCQEIFWEYYNPRCEPPWSNTVESKANFFDTIKNGYEYAGNESGCYTAVGVFSSLPPLPKPIEGWQEHVTKVPVTPVATGDVISPHRITKEDGQLLLSQCTIKSAHYDLVRAFDGITFDGCKLIRSGKIFYRYNDKKLVWEILGDDVIRALIQRFFSEYKPSDTFTNGIFNVLKDFVNENSIENGSWISDPDTNCDDLALFKNGIVDFSDPNNVTVTPHTPDYFSLNNVGYNWDDKATCPEWLKFLNTVWDTDLTKSNIDTLQEFMGYMLTSDMSLQACLFLLGASRGGKGVITKAMTSIIGSDNVCTPALNKINNDSAIHQIIKSKLTMIPDARNVARNNRDGVLSQLLALTGEDSISFHEMYIGSKTSIVKSKLVLSANSMPEFIDSSGALTNRMKPLIFHKSFAGKEDRLLSSRIAKETAGIAAWAIKGLLRLRQNNNLFTQSKDSDEELLEIRNEMFPLSDYVKQCCVIGSNYEVSLEELYSAYKLYTVVQGIKIPYTSIQFGKILRASELGLRKFRGIVNGVGTVRETGFQGIKLNKETIKKAGLGGFTPITDG